MTDSTSSSSASEKGAPSPLRLAWLLAYLPALWLLNQVTGNLLGLGAVVSLVFAGAIAMTFKGALAWRAHLYGAILAVAVTMGVAVTLAYERPLGIALLLAPLAAVAVVGLLLRVVLPQTRWFFTGVPEIAAVVFGITLWQMALGAPRWLGMDSVNEDVFFELMAAPQPEPLDDAQRKASVEVVRKALKQADPAGDPAAARSVGASSSLSRSVSFPVYVLLFHPELGHARGQAVGGSLGEALAEATARALKDSKKGQDWKNAEAEVRIQIDLAGKDIPFRVTPGLKPNYKFKAKSEGLLDRARGGWTWLQQVRPLYEVEPGVDGVLLSAGEKKTVMIPADPILFGWLTPRIMGRDLNLDTMMKKVGREAGGGGDLWLKEGTTLRKFRSYSFGQPVPGKEVVEFYRTNVPLSGVTSQTILDAIDIGGQWLLNTAKNDGTFLYEYLPNEDKYPKDYNWVRHAGAIYGLYHMYNMALREPQLHDDANAYLLAAAKAMQGVYRNLGTPKGAPVDRITMMEGVRAESGSAALVLMTFLERPKREEVTHPLLAERLFREDDQKIMDGLALTILDMIDDKGRVFRFYDEALKLDAVKKEPLYFPGECMLALARYYEVTGDKRWLEGAKKIGDYQIKWTFDKKYPNRIPDHWVMQALHRVYKGTKDEKYAKAVIKMGHEYNSEQFPPNKAFFDDYYGSYRRETDVPRTTRAASRTEALGGSVRAAWDLGRKSDAKAMEDALLWAAEHMIEQQFTPLNSYYMKRPDRALGALRMGIVDNDCRIDNNQHAAVGMTNALEVALKREGKAMNSVVTLPSLPTPEQMEKDRAELDAAEAAGQAETSAVPPSPGTLDKVAPQSPGGQEKTVRERGMERLQFPGPPKGQRPRLGGQKK